MKQLDLRKELRDLYNPSAREVEIIRVPKFNYLMVDGTGDPNSSAEFAAGIQALYAASYTLKFMIKKEKLVDYPVMALEGLWWADDPEAFRMGEKGDWKWTLMILQPGVVTRTYVKKAVAQAFEKKGFDALTKLRLEPFAEGLSLQIMHIGPYAEEGPTIEKVHAYAKDHGLALCGKHHEIYLSDPRRVSPAKMKTVVRQPVSRVKSIS
jgi:hypothetical protein